MMKVIILSFLFIHLAQPQTNLNSGSFSAGLNNKSLKTFYQKYATNESVKEMVVAFDEAIQKKNSNIWKLAIAKQSFAIKFELEDHNTKFGEDEIRLFQLRIDLLDEFIERYKIEFPQDEMPSINYHQEVKKMVFEITKNFSASKAVDDSNRMQNTEKTELKPDQSHSTKVNQN